MKNTANYNFKKPENTDLYNVQDFSDNMDAIDTALKALENGNENLLVNADFQLGTAGWTVTGKAVVTPTDNGATISCTGGYGYVNQYLSAETLNLLRGKTLMLSVSSGGTVYTQKVTMPSTGNYDSPNISIPTNGQMDLQVQDGKFYIRIYNSAGSDASFNIDWVKLEVGSVATPFIPPNKEVEKLKCGVADADTVDGLHASDFQNKDDVRLFTDYVSNLTEKTDIRAIMWKLPSGIYNCTTGTIPNLVTPFENTTGMHAEWRRVKSRSSGLQYGVLTLRTMTNNSEWAECRIFNNNDYTPWYSFLPLDGSKPMSGAFSYKGGYGRLNADSNWVSFQSWETNDGSLKKGRALQISNSKHGYGSIEKCLQLCDIVDGKETKYFVHHDGNSLKVQASAEGTAPTDDNAVWIVTS